MAFTMTADYELTGAFTGREIDANAITNRIESVQKKINTARVQAGSQYAALESAVTYTTDLTAQYELPTIRFMMNFSMETAHLAKNQILQQAATAMLAQANEGHCEITPVDPVSAHVATIKSGLGVGALLLNKRKGLKWPI